MRDFLITSPITGQNNSPGPPKFNQVMLPKGVSIRDTRTLNYAPTLAARNRKNKLNEESFVRSVKRPKLLVPLLALLRKTQLARELYHFIIFSALVATFALTVDGFQGDAFSRIRANRFIEEGYANCGAEFKDANAYGVTADFAGCVVEDVVKRAVEEGAKAARRNGTYPIGTASAGDFIHFVGISVAVQLQYQQVECTSVEKFGYDDQYCATVMDRTSPYDTLGYYGDSRDFQRAWRADPFGTASFAGTVVKDGEWGGYEFREVILDGPDTNLEKALERVKELRDRGFFNREVYHLNADFFTISELKREMNYHGLTFSRIPHITAGMISSGLYPEFFTAPVKQLVNRWEEYAPKNNGIAYQIIFFVLLCVQWSFFTTDYKFASMKAGVQYRVKKPNAFSVGSMVFYWLQCKWEGTKFFFFEYLSNPWSIVELGFLLLASAVHIFIIIVVAACRLSPVFRKMPVPGTTDWLDLTNTGWDNFFVVNFFTYGCSIAFFVATFKSFRFLRHVPGVRIFVLVIFKAWPRLKDFIMFFIITAIMLSLTCYSMFNGAGGNPLFATFMSSLGRSLELTFGQMDKESFLNSGIGVGNAIGVVFAAFWLLLIALALLAQNVLIAIISDAYNEAKEDPIVLKELQYMSETSALSMIFSLSLYYVTVFLSPLLNGPWILAHKRIQRYLKPNGELKDQYLNPDGSVRADLVPAELLTKHARAYRLKRGRPLQALNQEEVEAAFDAVKRPLQEVLRSFRALTAKEGNSSAFAGLRTLEQIGGCAPSSLFSLDEIIAALNAKLAKTEGTVLSELVHHLEDLSSAVKKKNASNGVLRSEGSSINWSALITSLARRAGKQPLGETLESFYGSFDFVVDIFAGIASSREIKSTSSLGRDDAPLWHPYCESWRYFSRRVMTSGLSLILGRWISSFASKNIFSILRILLLEWELAHTPAAMLLLSTFEDPGSDNLDAAVFNMLLDPVELLNYYVLTLKMTRDPAQPDVYKDTVIVRTCWSMLSRSKSYFENRKLTSIENMSEVVQFVKDTVEVYGRQNQAEFELTQAAEKAVTDFAALGAFNLFTVDKYDDRVEKTFNSASVKASEAPANGYANRFIPVTAATYDEITALRHSITDLLRDQASGRLQHEPSSAEESRPASRVGGKGADSATESLNQLLLSAIKRFMEDAECEGLLEDANFADKLASTVEKSAHNILHQLHDIKQDFDRALTEGVQRSGGAQRVVQVDVEAGLAPSSSPKQGGPAGSSGSKKTSYAQVAPLPPTAEESESNLQLLPTTSSGKEAWAN